jgi:hypothetical protein
MQQVEPCTELPSKWCFYLHLHDNPDWTIRSYIKMADVCSVEDTILLNDEICYDLIKKSMMFVMKNDVMPIWEDENNKNGGCFSFKVLNKDVEQVWREVFFGLFGGSITDNTDCLSKINGITLSPKKKFCILKIWMTDCSYDDPEIFINIANMNSEGCLFRKHSLEC